MAKRFRLNITTRPSRPRSALLQGAVLSQRGGGGGGSVGGDYVTREYFESLFEVVTISEATEDEEAVQCIRAKLAGLYSDGFISALGMSGSSGIGGGGTGGSLDTDAVLALLEAEGYVKQDMLLKYLTNEAAERLFVTGQYLVDRHYLTADDLPTIPDTSDLLSRDEADDLYVYRSGDVSWDGERNRLYIGDDSVAIGYAARAGFAGSAANATYASEASTAGTAAQLSTPRKLWDQSFDGGDDVNGSLYNVSNIYAGTGNSHDIGTADRPFGDIYARSFGGIGTGSAVSADIIKADTSLYIGDVLLTYDAAAKAIRVNNAGIYSDTYVSALGAPQTV